jgi:hypothetical protein
MEKIEVENFTYAGKEIERIRYNGIDYCQFDKGLLVKMFFTDGKVYTKEQERIIEKLKFKVEKVRCPVCAKRSDMETGMVMLYVKNGQSVVLPVKKGIKERYILKGVLATFYVHICSKCGNFKPFSFGDAEEHKLLIKSSKEKGQNRYLESMESMKKNNENRLNDLILKGILVDANDWQNFYTSPP